MGNTIQQLSEQLLCGDEMARGAALTGLTRAGDEGVMVLRQTLYHPDKAVSLGAARTLAAMDSPEHFEIMVEALASSNLLIAELAARALEKYGERAVAPLLAVLPNCHAFVQVGIVATLERIGSHVAVKPLMEVLKITEYATLRYMVIQALGSIGDPVATDLIRSFSDDPDYYVKERTKIAMSQLLAGGVDHTGKTGIG